MPTFGQRHDVIHMRGDTSALRAAYLADAPISQQHSLSHLLPVVVIWSHLESMHQVVHDFPHSYPTACV